MVKELQKKFTFAAMAAVTILLLTLVGAINLLHLATVTRQQEKMLGILSEADGNPAERFARDVFFMDKPSGSRDPAQQPRENSGGSLPDGNLPDGNLSDGNLPGGSLPEGRGEKGLPPERDGRQDPGRGGLFDRRISVDDAMSTRFFSVWLDEDGQIENVDTTQIYAVTEEGAREMALEILALKKKSGRVGSFRFLLRDRAEEEAAGLAETSGAGIAQEGESAALPEGKAEADAVPDRSQEHEAAAVSDKTQAKASAASSSGMFLVAMDVSGDDENLLLVLGISAVIAALCWAAMLLPVRILARRSIAPTALSIERQKQFVTNAGHELKTPLAIILANTEALELFNGESKWTRNIRAQTNRLSGLMQNLLTLSRMDENALRLERKPFDLDGLAREVWENFAQSAAARALVVEFPAAGKEKTMALGDRESIAQLLSILYDNAVKYTPRSGRILVRTAAEGKEIVLRQSNTLQGEGKEKGVRGQIPEDPERLFERFYRADEDRSRKKGGFGIGLSAARAIAAANRGTIRADVREGEIVFTFRIAGAPQRGNSWDKNSA